jgi:uroporphyrin-3 C-methyltransferase
MAAVEGSMSSLQGISTGARDAWLLAEAEYYMQIANAQLQLARNPELASLALTHADDRILQLADPRLTNIRQTLSDELRALKAMDKPDTAGITLTLASLAAAVESLPLKQDAASRDVEVGGTDIDPELTGMDRAMASLRNAVDGIVSVRRADEAMQPLIAPEAQYFLRANLALQLQAARLALLRGEEAVFRRSLDDADDWLEKYYDQDMTAVQSARATIAGIRDSVFVVTMPDISGSLRLLRQFNALAEAVEASEPAPAEAPGQSDEATETTEPEQDQ